MLLDTVFTSERIRRFTVKLTARHPSHVDSHVGGRSSYAVMVESEAQYP